MKGGLNRMVTLSAEGVLHDAANGDSGRGASIPVALSQMVPGGVLAAYDGPVCGHDGCFPKEFSRRKAEDAPSAKADVNATGAPAPEATPDSADAPQTPAKAKAKA